MVLLSVAICSVDNGPCIFDVPAYDAMTSHYLRLNADYCHALLLVAQQLYTIRRLHASNMAPSQYRPRVKIEEGCFSAGKCVMELSID